MGVSPKIAFCAELCHKESAHMNRIKSDKHTAQIPHYSGHAFSGQCGPLNNGASRGAVARVRSFIKAGKRTRQINNSENRHVDECERDQTVQLLKCDRRWPLFLLISGPFKPNTLAPIVAKRRANFHFPLGSRL
jgi:hypothetical protein